MPRQPRLVVAGYPHHVILRGNNRSAIFHNDSDRKFFIKYLKEEKEKTKSKIYAYCLMTNHVHLLIEPSTEGGLGKLMQSLGRRYVQRINKIYHRTGTLWEGRFKSSLVNKDEYLLACSRYIETNPVRAKMAEDPLDYSWSSFGHKAKGVVDVLVDLDPAYLGLGETEKERQANYNKLFLRMPEEEFKMIRYATRKGGVIGNKAFVDKMANILGREMALKPRGRPKKGNEKSL